MKEPDQNYVERLIEVVLFAESVFEDRQVVAQWLLEPNHALDGAIPAFHCETEIGAQNVRRILRSIETGGVA